MMPPPHMNMSMPPPSKKQLEYLATFFIRRLTEFFFPFVDAMLPPNLMNVPPQMVPPPQHNLNLIGPPGMPPMMPPPVMNPSMPPNRGNEDHRNSQPMDKRNESGPPSQWRSRETREPRDTRDKERDYRERDRGRSKSIHS